MTKYIYLSFLLLVRIEGAFSILFWALFGHVEMSNFNTNDKAQITEVTGHLLFATYSLVSVLVAINLLIAMLSNTYKKVDVSFVFIYLRQPLALSKH